MNDFTGDDLQVLHVDDEPDFSELSALQLERTDERLSVQTADGAEEALELLEAHHFDCVVSDYNMPGMDGIDLLREVRKRDEELPFILFTGRGSEEIASRAISVGVTDYLQKEIGSDQYTVLANRIVNTVEQTRAVKEVERTREFYSRILEHSWDYVIIVDPNGMIDYVSPAVERVMGYDPDELIGENSFEFPHPEDREKAFTALAQVIEDPEHDVTVEYRTQHADGSWRWIEVRGGNLLDDPYIEGIMVNVRDVTERKRQEKRLANQTEQFQELTQFMSHDVNNQLTIVEGNLERVSDGQESEYLEIAKQSCQRVQEMIEKIQHLAESGPGQLRPTRVNLAEIAQTSWENVRDPDATLEIGIDLDVQADPEPLQRLFENLFRNAIDHAGPAVTIEVGSLEEPAPAGFYVSDDGPGLAEAEADRVFESGYSSKEDGTGLGLAIVERIVEAHDWSVGIETAETGGARFEIRGLETVE